MILTLAEAQKINPDITQAGLDGYEADIRDFTANPFLVEGAILHGFGVESSGGETEIALAVDMVPPWLKAGATLLLSGGFNDGALVVVVDINGAALTVSGRDLIAGQCPDSTLALVRYPANVKTGLAKLIEYDKKMAGKIGIKSETISRMSLTYYDQNAGETSAGYPAALMEPFVLHRRIRWGQ